MSKGSKTAIEANDEVVNVVEIKVLKKRIRQLERVLGNKTLEVEILKKTVHIGREKASRGFPCPAWRISSKKGHGRHGGIPYPTPMNIAAARGLVRNDTAKRKMHSFGR